MWQEQIGKVGVYCQLPNKRGDGINVGAGKMGKYNQNTSNKHR